MKIVLRHSTTILSSLTYASGATNQKILDTVKLTANIPKIEIDAGILLSKRRYSHSLGTYNTYDVVISADELKTVANLDFVKAWFSAPYKYIALPSGVTYTNYIEVISESGDLPIQYIEDIIYLPEIELKLIGVQGV
jgi:hypothetical protein